MELNHVESSKVQPQTEIITATDQETQKNSQSQVSSVEGEMAKETSQKITKEGYVAVSKDGDILELSEQMKNKAGNAFVKNGTGKMSDATLANCSSGKLKQLLQQGQISKQQYEKAMKKKMS